MVQYLDPNQRVAFLAKSGAVITAKVAAGEPARTGTGMDLEIANYPYYSATHLKSKRVACWGNDNLRPIYYLNLLANSNINAQLIYTKVSLAMGRLVYFKERVEEGRIVRELIEPDPEVKAWAKQNKMLKFLRARATDFFILGNVWNKFTLARDPRQGIARVEHMDGSCCRLELQNQRSKRTEHHFVCADWTRPRFPDLDNSTNEKDKTLNVRRYTAFREEEPLKYFQSLHHSKLYWTGQAYYGIQPWHSGHRWIKYANQIPVWMDSNISNSQNIKYHIEYPANYFDYLDTMFESASERLKEKERVFNTIDDLLAGAENAQKTLFTAYQLDAMTNNQFGGWKITSITNDLKDDAFVDTFKSSNDAMTSAQGVAPVLADLQREGKFNSGSEQRIAAQIHEVLKTQEVREIMIEPLNIVRDVNGWDPDLQFGFMRRNIVTLAEDPAGMEDEKLLE